MKQLRICTIGAIVRIDVADQSVLCSHVMFSVGLLSTMQVSQASINISCYLHMYDAHRFLLFGRPVHQVYWLTKVTHLSL